MSSETSLWLNRNTLQGFTEKRGHAWHYRASDLGDESNHYPGAIPVEDIKRRLFFWEPVASRITNTYTDPATGEEVSFTDLDMKGIIRPDTGQRFKYFGNDYTPHSYSTWLVDYVESFLTEDLQPASAGLLKGGAVAWVQVEAPETAYVEGFGYRPFITAASSLNGSLSSTYLTGSIAVVCDNTFAAAMGEKTHRAKVRHSVNSLSEGKRLDIKAALHLMEQTRDAFGDTIKALLVDPVDLPRWSRFVDKLVPVVDSRGDAKTGRGLTMAETKRDALNNLYRNDVRVAPYAGTALGVLQAVSTYEAHLSIVRNQERVEKNTLNFLQGKTQKADNAALDLLATV